MTRVLHCPRCGDVLERDANGELQCRRGSMGLAKSLERELFACFVDRTRTPRAEPFSFGIGGTWWCPGCGVPIEERTKGDLRCPQCDVSLREFVYRLVEL